MISGIGGAGGFDTTVMTTRLFRQFDTNSDNSIDESAKLLFSTENYILRRDLAIMGLTHDFYV